MTNVDTPIEEQEDALPGEKPEESSLQNDPLPTPSGADPLDEIEDAQELKTIALSTAAGIGSDAIAELKGVTDPAKIRAVAKKYRAIAHRRGKDKPEDRREDTPPKPVVPAPTDYVTKRDQARINSQKAIKAAKAADAEVDENWDAILPFYRNTRGQEDPDIIAEDIKDAVTLWRSRKPADKPADPAAPLRTSTERPASSRPAPKPEGRQTQSLRKKSEPMANWYKKKEE